MDQISALHLNMAFIYFLLIVSFLTYGQGNSLKLIYFKEIINLEGYYYLLKHAFKCDVTSSYTTKITK